MIVKLTDLHKLQTVMDSEIDLLDADIKHLEDEKVEIEEKASVMKKE